MAMTAGQHPDYDLILRTLNLIRADRGLTLGDLAERIGDHASNVGTTLRGERAASAARICAIARAMGHQLTLIPAD